MTDEKHREACRKWYQKNKEYCSERNKKYRLSRLEELREAGRRNGKRRYQNNPELYAQKNREQRQKHLEKRIAYGKKHYYANIENQRTRAREWYWQHKNDPQYRQRKRKWDRGFQSKRRALKRSSAINLAAIKQWMSTIQAEKTFRCYHCDERFPIERLHFDHIIPLSKGGPHTITNLCASCNTCNWSKKDKSMRVWIRMGQQSLEL